MESGSASGAGGARGELQARGRDRDHRFWRRLRERLDIMRNSGFQGGQGGQLCGQTADSARDTAKARG